MRKLNGNHLDLSVSSIAESQTSVMSVCFDNNITTVSFIDAKTLETWNMSSSRQQTEQRSRRRTM